MLFKSIREFLGYSRQTVAQEAGVSASTIRNVENGTSVNGTAVRWYLMQLATVMVAAEKLGVAVQLA